MSFIERLADCICDGGLAQSSQPGEPIYWRGFRRVFLVGPCGDLGNDIDACSLGAGTTGKIVEVYGSTESRVTRTR